jgi:rubrerythrin
MNLGDAILTAIKYEIKVRDTYNEAVEAATDDTGKRIFGILAKEEQGHIDYLESRLSEWQKTGSVTPEELETAIPSVDAIDEGIRKLEDHVEKVDNVYNAELDMLRRALQVELETGAFYKQMVDELDGVGQELFERFLEIEDGHRAIVQAEIDSVSGTGFWFDMAEFNLEGA